MNGDIRAPTVRLVTPEGSEVVPLQHALARAKDEGLDLVQVAESGEYPVVRVMDYRRMQFEQRKRAKDAKKEKVASRRAGVQKEVQLRPHVGEHDLDVKLTRATHHMEKGYKVRFVVHLRQTSERAGGQALLDRIVERMSSAARVLDQNVRKPHPKMIDIVMMPLPGTVKRPGAGEEAAGD